MKSLFEQLGGTYRQEGNYLKLILFSMAYQSHCLL